MDSALTAQDKEAALQYEGTWYGAIKARDYQLLRYALCWSNQDNASLSCRVPGP
jgi:hypothetical protein